MSSAQSSASKAALFGGMLVLGSCILGKSICLILVLFDILSVVSRSLIHFLIQTYQLGRAFTAVTLKEDTVDFARRHALRLIRAEERLGIFWELRIQRFFLRHPLAMTWINWIYSFIHIPGTIAFLVWLYYYTITRNRIDEPQPGKPRGSVSGSPAGPLLYQARRRTLAVCNLLAFVVFTLWPCMPPRLLSDPSVEGPEGELARSYGFIDTVHGVNGAGSVWTENRFCNQYGKCIPSHAPVKAPCLTSTSCDAVLAFRILAHDRLHHHDRPPPTPSSPHYPDSVEFHYWAAPTLLAPDSLSCTGLSLSVHDSGSHCGHGQPFYTRCDCGGFGLRPGLAVQWCTSELAANRGLLPLDRTDPQTGAIIGQNCQHV